MKSHNKFKLNLACGVLAGLLAIASGCQNAQSNSKESAINPGSDISLQLCEDNFLTLVYGCFNRFSYASKSSNTM